MSPSSSATSFVVVSHMIAILLLATASQGQLMRDGASSPPPNSTVAPDPAALCREATDCESCMKVSFAKCFYCNDNSTNNGGCYLYPAEDVFPTKQCPLSNARWGVCWVNFQSLIIAMSVIAGVMLVSVGCACYCCCCRNRYKDNGRSEARFEREAQDRQQRHADRRVEREAKMTAIRQKYGLNQDTASYNRMDN